MEYRSFESFEEIVRYMQQATDAANTSLAPEQKAIGWGDYWIRFVPQEQMIIFGRVLTLEQLVEGERKAGATEEELVYTIGMVQENYERGYLFGVAYSVWEPEGELGDTHRANMWPITQAQFEEAKEARWTPNYIPGLHTWLKDAYMAFRLHVLRLTRGEV